MRYATMLLCLLLVGCDITGADEERPQITTTTFDLDPAEMQVYILWEGERNVRRTYYQTVTVEAMTENVLENGVVHTKVEYEDSTYSLPVLLGDALENDSGSIQGSVNFVGEAKAAKTYEVRALCEWLITSVAGDDSLTQVQPITLKITTIPPGKVVSGQ